MEELEDDFKNESLYGHEKPVYDKRVSNSEIMEFILDYQNHPEDSFEMCRHRSSLCAVEIALGMLDREEEFQNFAVNYTRWCNAK